jgi:hypothetical protein
MIRKEEGKVVLYSKDGSKKLGVHKSQTQAIKQEVAIKFAKARAAGKKKRP